jgi:diacylglycerol kinase family enzyme
MKIIVLLNSSAGKSAAKDAKADEQAIHAAFAFAGVTVDLHQVPGKELTSTARKLSDESTNPCIIVAAGGDGTQSAVAAALAGSPTPLGVLPMGTLNHFAKDLGIPLDIDEAARVIVKGRPHPVDVAQLNDRVFVNNSSIGLYPHVVRHRDQLRQRLGHGKWYAMLIAFVVMFRRFPVVNIRMSINGESLPTTAPFVFIGNNEYRVDGMEIGQRASLENGTLSLYFAHRTGRLGMLRLALRALGGRLRQDRDFEEKRAAELWIDSHRHELSVAIDGEVIRQTPPLHYRIRPKSLMVMLPADSH